MGFGSVTAVDSAVAGVVKHFELSSDSPGDLEFLRAGAFTLSVFTFTALAPGVAAFELVIHSFGDSLGDPLAASVTGGLLRRCASPGDAPRQAVPISRPFAFEDARSASRAVLRDWHRIDTMLLRRWV
jgi:hypothetical protein